MVIYKTTNLINGTIYVGQDSKNNPDYLGSGKVLKYAISKHGVENFTKEILEICNSKGELDEREIYWINKLSATTIGYNIALGGGDTYTNMSDEDKRVNRRKKSVNAKNKNVMHDKSVYDCWVDKYGIEEADILLKERNEKHVISMKERAIAKFNRLDRDYGELVLKSWETKTIDEIHVEFSGVLSKSFIRKMLKSRGVNTLSRHGMNAGTSNGNAKLTCDEVKRIRELKGSDTYGNIGKLFGVSSTVIGSIIRGVAYKGC